MNYDTIIVEMLSRIQKLEEEAAILRKKSGAGRERASEQPKITTTGIKLYIAELKRRARERGETSLTLCANDIHKSLKLRSRMPMVCNAMRQSMSPGDRVVKTTASGYSSTLEIEYMLAGPEPKDGGEQT